jgi:hypothetical protein
MGSYNTNPGHAANPEQNQQQTILQELNSEENGVISRLINSILYYIDCVYILRSKNKYRLVALQHGKVLFDKCYTSLRGCRIAFQKTFKDRPWHRETKAQWTPFYDPYKNWLEEKNSHLES